MSFPHPSSVSVRCWKTLLAALLCAPVLTGCGRRAAAPPAVVPEVATIVVSTKAVQLTTELPGRTCPYRIAEIRPQVSGLIQKRLFTEGSQVQAGEQLYQIDSAPFQAAFDNAQAALARAQANLPALQSRASRYKEALADKSVSQQDFDDADAALKQAQADLQYYTALVETARINLEYTRVGSPITGRIGTSAVTEGAIVTAYQALALATIQQLNPIYVNVTQSTTELLHLQQHLRDGQVDGDGTNSGQVDLILEDGTKYPVKGVLQFRDVTVDPTTASVILRLVFPNPNTVLLPGMFVRAVVEEGVDEHAILVPQQAVSRDPKGNPLAMIVNASGQAEQRLLVLDRALGDQWLVESGLAPGDHLIVEGMQNAKPALPVHEVPFNDVQKPAPKTVAQLNSAN
jgi:membrane fusion protein (multidrug efflux system)